MDAEGGEAAADHEIRGGNLGLGEGGRLAERAGDFDVEITIKARPIEQ